MKRTFVVTLLVAVVLVVAAPVSAHDYDPDDSDYFLRYVAYLIHPIGYGLEALVTRPAHWVVSQPHLRVVFGHDPRHERDELYRYPECNLCRPAPMVLNCPKCKRPILKAQDQYWDSRLPWLEARMP